MNVSCLALKVNTELHGQASETIAWCTLGIGFASFYRIMIIVPFSAPETLYSLVVGDKTYLFISENLEMIYSSITRK